MIQQIRKFCKSRHRGVYNELAIKFRVSPWKIYKLAHGKRAVTNVDSDILEELFERGIISGIRPY
ncbi:hypothetical protein [Bacteroides congonensis]|jgi:hypothetical protein|uniref:hypothetical protein n=1 Tax=Bacteroides congonensis TaxID=1871006 RepID=UPI0003388017|nr:hypothetical protein [Bacteroides congonensis]CDA87619.1 putative uncharacterized protein [Bacteroides sp. CAG:754]